MNTREITSKMARVCHYIFSKSRNRFIVFNRLPADTSKKVQTCVSQCEGLKRFESLYAMNRVKHESAHSKAFTPRMVAVCMVSGGVHAKQDGFLAR